MKERITISIERRLLKKIDSSINNYLFANRSHGFEYLISEEKRKAKSRK
jgi:metal-responsive CopG/Arc/MetJ family transcriptional regulator